MPVRFIVTAPPALVPLIEAEEEVESPPDVTIPVDVVECGAYALFDYEMDRAKMDHDSRPYVWPRVSGEYRNRARVVLEPFMRGAT